jgi:hypothetical protein
MEATVTPRTSYLPRDQNNDFPLKSLELRSTLTVMDLSHTTLLRLPPIHGNLPAPSLIPTTFSALLVEYAIEWRVIVARPSPAEK